MATAEAQVKPEELLAELRKQGASNAEAIAEIKKTHEALVEKLGAPDFSGLRASSDATAAYWQASESKNYRISRAKNYPVDLRRLPKNYRPAGPGHEHWPTYGDFLVDVIKGGSDFEGRIKSHTAPLYDRSMRKAIEGMSTTVGSDGGFFVMPEFSETMFERAYESPLFGRLSMFTVGGNNMTFRRSAETSRVAGSRAGGIQGYWVDEGATITDTKPKTKTLSLKLLDLFVMVYLTNDLVEDASAVEQFVRDEAGKEIAFMLDEAVIRGSGVGQPIGILNAGATISIAKETGQTATTIWSENIDKMWARRYAGSNNYVWLTNQDTHPQLQQMQQILGTSGAVLYRPPTGLAGSPYATLKGAPLLDGIEQCSTLGTQGDIILADLAQIVGITKGGIAQAESIHVQFVTDQKALRFKMRVNFRPWEDTPVTPNQGSATQSSFIMLDTRS